MNANVSRITLIAARHRAAIAACTLLCGVLLFLLLPLPQWRISPDSSLRIISAEGRALRQYQSREGAYSQWCALENFPPFLLRAVLAAEDRRFYYHPGIDPLAMLRAAFQNLHYRRIRSGGSTITQQLARIAYRDILPKNRLLRKIFEMMLAVRLEVHCSKRTILESYCNRVPLTFNQAGFASASVRIFGKHVRFATREECAALAVLIRQNRTSKNDFQKRFSALWLALSEKRAGDISALEKAIFYNTAFSHTDAESKTLHFENWVRGLDPSLGGELRTTISGDLSEKIMMILNAELSFLEHGGAGNGAVIVLKNPRTADDTLGLVAMVGSRNFFGEHDGQINGCVAVREAGSTLKPLLYALAMTEKKITPDTMINDRDIAIPVGDGAAYHPRNNDLAYWGPMTISEALAASRNVPAVVVLSQVGINRFYDYLKNAGFNHLNDDPARHGLSLALGTGGASLLQLAAAYSAIANNGIFHPVYIGTDRRGNRLCIGKKNRLMPEHIAYQLQHILSSAELRRRAYGNRNFFDFPFDVAAKTGTSKDFRDSWTVGFTSDYVVGVWIGNFSGKPMKEISGGWGAGRVFHQVMRLLAEGTKPRFRYPKEFAEMRRCRKSGHTAGPACPSYRSLIRLDEDHGAACAMRHGAGDDNPLVGARGDITIVSPTSGETYIIDPLRPRNSQLIPITIHCGSAIRNDGGGKKFWYQINNNPRTHINRSIHDLVSLPGGEHRLRIYENDTIVEMLTFTVQ